MRWDEGMVPDQTGKSVVITGSNTGIGYHMARAMACKGANVIMACRSTEKAEGARDAIVSEFPDSSISVMELDLADLSSVERFSKELISGSDRLDVLINNAGVMIPPKSLTKDGFELQFGTNHLGHFALTGRLLPLLESTEGSRVVTVSSIVHNSGRIDFDDLNGDRKRYSKWGFYSQSKIANLLFSLELARRLEASGSSVRSLASHPGYTATDLQRHSLLWRFLNLIVAMPARRGAESTLYAATEDDALDYPYWGPTGIIEMMGWTGRARINSRARDEAVASRLWEVSESMTGVSYLMPPS
ncbi:MAG: short-chain dehydrogenase [Gammaproteobacteria bacterium]|nr:short-chain dehydrogenase [Gammaproteobacteria bacterium]